MFQSLSIWTLYDLTAGWVQNYSRKKSTELTSIWKGNLTCGFFFFPLCDWVSTDWSYCTHWPMKVVFIKESLKYMEWFCLLLRLYPNLNMWLFWMLSLQTVLLNWWSPFTNILTQKCLPTSHIMWLLRLDTNDAILTEGWNNLLTSLLCVCPSTCPLPECMPWSKYVK